MRTLKKAEKLYTFMKELYAEKSSKVHPLKEGKFCLLNLKINLKKEEGNNLMVELKETTSEILLWTIKTQGYC